MKYKVDQEADGLIEMLREMQDSDEADGRSTEWYGKWVHTVEGFTFNLVIKEEQDH